MDELDRRLLDLLRADARLSMAELGRRVGLSRTATLARVRRLEERGLIAGYHAEVPSPSATHVARVAITLATPDVGAYVERLAQLPEVQEAESLSGDFDLLIRVAAGSAARLDELLDRINAWPQTRRTTTFMVLNRYL